MIILKVSFQLHSDRPSYRIVSISLEVLKLILLQITGMLVMPPWAEFCKELVRALEHSIHLATQIQSDGTHISYPKYIVYLNNLFMAGIFLSALHILIRENLQGAIITITILKMRKLRHRGLSNLHQITEL